MPVPTAVDGAATDTRASAATSGAQAATGASHAETTEVVGGAAKEIIAPTVENRAWIGRISTSPSPRKCKSWMSADGEFLCGERVDAAFAAIVGPDLVCVDTGCNKIILMEVPEDQNWLTTYTLCAAARPTAAANGHLEIAA